MTGDALWQSENAPRLGFLIVCWIDWLLDVRVPQAGGLEPRFQAVIDPIRCRPETFHMQP
jgi:hypothetical protein